MSSVSGLMLIDKERGPSSAEIVRRVSRVLGKKVKIGHAGTLDPDASGLLVLIIGAATRLSDDVMRLPKTYEATVRFGIETDTYDATGKEVNVKETSALTADRILAVLPEFTGAIRQRPPAFSAVKIEGARAYELARAGDIRELPERDAMVYELTMESFSNPDAVIHVKCGKGMYLRTLAHDIGIRLGCGAHVLKLRRTAIGPFQPTVNAESITKENWIELLVDPAGIFDGKPCFKLNKKGASNLRRGIPLRSVDFIERPTEPVGERAGILDEDGKLIAVAEIGHGGSLLNRRIIQPL